MKKVFTCMFLLFITAALTAQSILVPFKEGNKWGFADVDGNIKITPQYTAVDFFNRNYALVAIDTNKKGLIDRNGNQVVSPKYKDARYLKKNLFLVTSAKDLQGIVHNDKTILSPKYTVIKYAINNIFIIKKKDKMGAIAINEQTGKTKQILPIKYKTVAYSKHLKRFICNYKDEAKEERSIQGELLSSDPLTAKKARDISSVSRPFSSVQNTNTTSPIEYYTDNGKQGIHYTHPQGKVSTIPAQYDSISTKYSQQNCFVARKDGQWGAVTIDNKPIIPFQYQDINQDLMIFNSRATKYNAQFIVKKNDKWGIIGQQKGDEKSYNLVPFIYDEITPTTDQAFYLIKQGNNYGAIKNDNTFKLIEPQYNEILNETQRVSNFLLLAIKQADGSIVYLGQNGVEFFK